MAKKLQFLSYRIRIWNEQTTDGSKTDVRWKIEAENLQTSQRWAVEALNEMSVRDPEWVESGVMAGSSRNAYTAL